MMATAMNTAEKTAPATPVEASPDVAIHPGAAAAMLRNDGSLA